MLELQLKRKLIAVDPGEMDLVMVGYTRGLMYFFVLCTLFFLDHRLGYSVCLQALLTVESEMRLGGDEYAKRLEYTMFVFGMLWSNEVCIFDENYKSDNCNTKKYNLALVGCASHRFNRAVNGLLQVQGDICTWKYIF